MFDDVSATSYLGFMGRFSVPLSPLFIELGLPTDATSAVDVGCGPGVLTAVLAERLGATNVAACDPAPDFVAAATAAHPGVDVRVAGAEEMPFEDDAYDAALAQLVVQFMSDPLAGVQEMARVTRPGGRVAACVWDHGGGTGPLSPFWHAVQRRDPSVVGEGRRTGTSTGDLARLFNDAGLRDVEESRLVVSVAFPTFDDWWLPYTDGVGPAGSHFRGLPEPEREGLVADLRTDLGDGPFTIDAAAWAAVGTV